MTSYTRLVRRPLAACLALLAVGCAVPGADAPAPSRAAAASASCSHTNEAIEREIGYCEVVRVGRTVYVSGMVARGPMSEAVPRVYASLGKVLAANGLSFADVVKENVYATDLDAFIAHKDARKPFFGQHLPAATWVQVQRLYDASFVVEVEVIAEARE
jgi:2-iminobutanoate/2-iminopropanoate deaminase